MKSQRLKPLLGIRPGIYITALLVLLLLALLFWLFMLPGIRSRGSEVSITTSAPGAAVFIDGEFAGSSPLELFIPAGEREIRIAKPCFRELTAREEIGSRVLFTRFAPKREKLSYDLEMEDLTGYLSWRIQDLYQWSLITNYTSTYQYPEVITETAEDIVAVSGAEASSEFAEFIALLPYLASSDKITEDMEQALQLLEFTLPDDPEPSDVSADVRSRATLQLEELGIEFIEISGEGIEPFFISASLVGSDLFDQFTEEEPLWHQDNRDELLQQRLVDETYRHTHDQFADTAVNISFHAAAAFVQWADGLYDEFILALPNALDWEHAAAALGADRLEGLWQWTSSPFYPGAPRQYERQHELLEFETHYHLKGGGSSRAAALPPSACSPVTGFRLLLIKE